ncbi:MAG: hypothetical protein C0592_13380 [Marinilabiliales bacterium]|nr:MAG: hypothetical protein C0592_13380 [Marinilabiliales bacterium]
MNTDQEKTYPKGHFVSKWMVLGMAMFSGIGVPLSVVADNFSFIGIGPAIGVGFGAGIGAMIEKKYEREGRIRPMNEQETKRKKWGVILGFVFLIAGVVALLLFLNR